MLSDLCHWKRSLWINHIAVSHSQCLEVPQVMLPCRHELLPSSGFIPFCGRGLVRSHCWVQAWLGSSGSWGQLPSFCNTWTRSAGTCAAPSPSGHASPEGHTQQVTNPGTQGTSEQVNQTLPASGTVPKECPTGPCSDWGTLPSVSAGPKLTGHRYSAPFSLLFACVLRKASRFSTGYWEASCSQNRCKT